MMKLLVLVVLLVRSAYGQNPPQPATGPDKPGPPQPWLTLDGKRPAVVARGGLSGLYPDSSEPAIDMALSLSVPGVIIFCNLQQSKDGHGYCHDGLQIDKTTNVPEDAPTQSYDLDGQEISGHFFKDFSDVQIANLSLVQSVESRTYLLDNLFEIPPVEKVRDAIDKFNQKPSPGPSGPPARFWLHVQDSSFYALSKLDPTFYVEELLKRTRIDIISSNEIGILKTLSTKINKAHTQLIFYMWGDEEVEPTTKQTYGELLNDLKAIKMFASGIVVSKQYIWPADNEGYLSSEPTTLVHDAHKEGLQVYAYSFANDVLFSHNYSYDPSLEYLQFVDNGKFAVDGFITDFPNTASEAMACLAHNKNASRHPNDNRLVISHNGASGVYPGSTNLAYLQAADDGADIIDCSVQMTKDSIAFCFNSSDLSTGTNAMITLVTKSSAIPELQAQRGIFSFDLTWAEIQNLKPEIANPAGPDMLRNPVNMNKGKLVTLSEFLELAKQKKVRGVMITIKNAAYLASKKGLNIVEAVASGLSNASMDKQSTQEVWIRSEDSAVLSTFSNTKTYKRVFLVEEKITSVSKQALDEIKKFADAVSLHKGSIVTDYQASLTGGNTSIVSEMHKANLSVYAGVFRNEFTSILQDFSSSAITEIATFLDSTVGVDGVVTDFPATAASYLRSPCTIPGVQPEFMIRPVVPGDFVKTFQGLPQPEAPTTPPLDVADVVSPPLPPVSKMPIDGAPAPSVKNNQTANVANFGFSLFISVIILGFLV